MLENILEDCKKQLSAALLHKKHSYRYFTLATQKKDGGSHLRTVVLRDYDPLQMQFTIYTDLRSKKVEELTDHPQAQFLFYDATRLIQLVVDAHLVECTQDTHTYQNLPKPSKKDYSSKQTPGTTIERPDQIVHDFSKGYFTKLTFQAKQLEYLKLKRPNHIRTLFCDSDQWKGQFLAP